MHGEVVEKWAEIFGSENVSVLVVDEQKPEFLYESINDYLGLPSGYLKPEQEGSNRSLSVEEVSLLLELNRRFPKEREWNEYLIFIRNGYVRELTDNVALKAGSSKLLTPGWAVSKSNQLASESKKKIQELGVTVYGDLNSLDTAKVPEGEPEYSTTIDIPTVAQAMLVFDKQLSRKIPLPWLVNWTSLEILRRFKWGVKSFLRMR
jgi:hypothetical protein